MSAGRHALCHALCRVARQRSGPGGDAASRLPGLLLAAVVLSGLGLSALLLPGLLSPPGLPGGVAGAQEDADGNGLPRVEVEMPPVEPTVGDRVALRLAVTTAANGLTPRFPAWGETWGETEIFEVTEPSRATPEGTATTTWQQTVTLAAFRTGRIPLPPQELVVPTADGRSRRLTTPADLALEVQSVLPRPEDGEDGEEDGAIPEPLPEKDLVSLPLGAPFWWTLALALLALAFVGWLLWRRRHRESATGARPHLVPIEELRRALEDARAVTEPEEGLARISLSLRRYLGRRLGFPAAEGTTTEVRRQLAARHLPDGLPERCGRLLATCDLVKFARQPASREDVERWAAVAAELADRVEGHLRPPEETGDGPHRGHEEAA